MSQVAGRWRRVVLTARCTTYRRHPSSETHRLTVPSATLNESCNSTTVQAEPATRGPERARCGVISQCCTRWRPHWVVRHTREFASVRHRRAIYPSFGPNGNFSKQRCPAELRVNPRIPSHYRLADGSLPRLPGSPAARKRTGRTDGQTDGHHMSASVERHM